MARPNSNSRIGLQGAKRQEWQCRQTGIFRPHQSATKRNIIGSTSFVGSNRDTIRANGRCHLLRIDHDVLAVYDLEALGLILALDLLAGVAVDKDAVDAIAGALFDRMKRNALGGAGGRVEADVFRHGIRTPQMG